MNNNKVVCDCGVIYSKGYLKKHFKSDRHKANIFLLSVGIPIKPNPYK